MLLYLRNSIFTADKWPIKPKVFSFKKLAHYFRGPSKPKSTYTFEDAVSSLISILPQLSNVSTLDVELKHAPSDVVTPLFQSICLSFKNLDELSMCGYLDNCRVFVEVCESLSGFEKLEVLHVELVNRLSPEQGDRERLGEEDAAILVKSFAPFVGRVAPTLENLGVRSSTAVDFSGFYDVLAATDFPALKKLSIRMAFDQTLGQPESLKLFLLGCRTSLEDLELRLNIDRAQLDPSTEELLGTSSRIPLDPSTEEPLGTWLINFAQNESEFSVENFVFPKLMYLNIYPGNTEAGLQALLFIIRGSAPTLLELNIWDRYFPPYQAKVVINTMSGRLKWLRMNAVYLDVELLDLLVQTLPCLEELWLAVTDVVGSDGVSAFQ